MKKNYKLSYSKNSYIKNKLKFSLILLNISNFKNKCMASKARDESNDDYIIDFFRKTGKYPSTGYFESTGVYGTPMILKSHDSSMWTILFTVCFCALLLGIGILLLANYVNCIEENEINKSEFDDVYYESSDDEIKNLNYLQKKFVKTIEYPNISNPHQYNQYGNYQYNQNPQYFYK